MWGDIMVQSEDNIKKVTILFSKEDKEMIKKYAKQHRISQSSVIKQGFFTWFNEKTK